MDIAAETELSQAANSGAGIGLDGRSGQFRQSSRSDASAINEG